MRISIERAMIRGDSGYKPCELCEAEFEPTPVVVRVDPYVEQICGEGAEAVRRYRPERGVPVAANRPTWGEYQKAVREHPEFMMTEDELDRANELGLYWASFELADLG
jgi:hypothetical protein